MKEWGMKENERAVIFFAKSFLKNLQIQISVTKFGHSSLDAIKLLMRKILP
jgi:hypothetical protein